MKPSIPFKCPYNEFSCVVMEDWTIEQTVNCTDCPHKPKWTVEPGIAPETDIYKMSNGLRVVHNKNLNRAYVQSSDSNVDFSPIDTSAMTADEWNQTLLGISKL